jgi:hypothetical protein
MSSTGPILVLAIAVTGAVLGPGRSQPVIWKPCLEQL